MVTAIEAYTNQVNLTLEAIANTSSELYEGFARIEPPLIKQSDLLKEQIDVTRSNTGALIQLSEALNEQGPTRIARGSGFVDTGIFLGIS
jgi:hypothetical protein